VAVPEGTFTHLLLYGQPERMKAMKMKPRNRRRPQQDAWQIEPTPSAPQWGQAFSSITGHQPRSIDPYLSKRLETEGTLKGKKL